MRIDAVNFRPTDQKQQQNIKNLAAILTQGNVSRLLRLAVDELIERHAGTLEEMAPLLEAKEQAEAAIRAAAERQV